MKGSGRSVREPVVMALGGGWVRWAYEANIIGLALIVVWFVTLPDEGWTRAVNLAISRY